jgi:hypothetical protein
VPGVPAGALGEAGVSGPLKLAVKPPADIIREDAVQHLEELLAAVKAGEVDSVMLVWEPANAVACEFWVSGSPHLSTTVGRLETLKHGQIRRLLDDV